MSEMNWNSFRIIDTAVAQHAANVESLLCTSSHQKLGAQGRKYSTNMKPSKITQEFKKRKITTLLPPARK
jgi:hypothetical protein